jgi:hypothetical protein
MAFQRTKSADGTMEKFSFQKVHPNTNTKFVNVTVHKKFKVKAQ